LDRLKLLIETLKSVRNKPELFVGDYNCTQAFISGINASAFTLLNIEFDFQTLFWKVVVERGWKKSANLMQYLIETGLDEANACKEIISINIIVWEIYMNELDIDNSNS
jgi:hypothetical protein